MIIIDNIELSNNTVKTNEAFIIKITAHEVLAKWDDLNPDEWQTTKAKTWNSIKDGIWIEPNRWQSFIVKTWDTIKRKIF